MKNLLISAREWAEDHIKIVAAIVAVFAMLVTAGVAYGLYQRKHAEPSRSAVESSVASAPVKPAHKASPGMSVRVKSSDDKVNASSSPVIVHVESTDNAQGKIDFYHATPVVSSDDSINLPEGAYKLSYSGVINSDGSIAKPVLPAPVEPVVVASTVDKPVVVELGKTIPAQSVSPADVKVIVDTVRDAVRDGDMSLNGDAGKAVVKVVEVNAKANSYLQDEGKDKPKASAQDAGKPAAPSESKPKAASSTVVSAPAPKPVVSRPSAPAPAPRRQSARQSSTSAPAPKPAAKPARKGHWQDVTKQVWVPNVVTVVDKPAWTETVPGRAYTRFSNGHVIYSNGDINVLHAAVNAYNIEMIKAGTPVSFQDLVEPGKTIQHPAVTHTVDKGHYETKVVDRKWVED